MITLKRYISITILFSLYSIAILISKFGRVVIKQRKKTNRININGTFHNPNWFFAHIEPIVKSGYGQVTLVTDEKIADLEGLKYSCPPSILSKILTRALSKFIYTFINGVKEPADIYVGYHIFPSALTSLICARLLGSKCVYQVTSGQLEIEGGGWNSENRLLTMLHHHSGVIEKLALKLTNEFDLVIVRGSGAKQYLINSGVTANIETVTGSVIVEKEFTEIERDIDIIFVGRLTEYKRPLFFIEVLEQLKKINSNFKTNIVGDGPDFEIMKSMISNADMDANVSMLGRRSDVPELLKKSKLLVMTSRWEGVSIAMLEAMAMGVVPIVSDVGDLKDYVKTDETGYIFDKNNKEGFVDAIQHLLSDNEHRKQMSEACRNLVKNTSSKEVVSKKWLTKFKNI